MEPEQYDDEYWRRYDRLIWRRRIGCLWYPLTIVVFVFGGKLFKLLGLDLMYLGLGWFAVGIALAVRVRLAQCPCCGKSFTHKAEFWAPQPLHFSPWRCISCGHVLP